MNNKKVISSLIAKFKVAFPYYFEKLTDEEFMGMVALYNDQLSMYSCEALENAFNTIVRRSKFMPTLQEIIEECEKFKTNKKLYIVEVMKKAGYFKADCEIEKTIHFIEENNIPDWLLKDMKKFGYAEDNLLTGTETKLLEGNNA